MHREREEKNHFQYIRRILTFSSRIQSFLARISEFRNYAASFFSPFEKQMRFHADDFIIFVWLSWVELGWDGWR